MYKISLNIKKEVSENYLSAFEFAKENGFFYIETGSVIDCMPLHLIEGDELEEIRCSLIDFMLRIEVMSLPSNALSFDELKKFIRNAHLLNVKNILIPASFVPADKLESSPKISYIRQISKAARLFGIGVIFENCSKSALSCDSEMNELSLLLNDENVSFSYDPFEFVKEKHHPFFHMFYGSKLKNKISVLRINDGLYRGVPTRLCKGNGEIKELVSILLSRSFDGIFSIDPYMDDFEKEYKETRGVVKPESPYKHPWDILADLKEIFKSI
ncbi:MAG: hypothetical protein E7665_09985 [Ruminococcaceae bacterium]|nr:hypothetical protein [Oscillospiraceae bacterium]